MNTTNYSSRNVHFMLLWICNSKQQGVCATSTWPNMENGNCWQYFFFPVVHNIKVAISYYVYRCICFIMLAPYICINKLLNFFTFVSATTTFCISVQEWSPFSVRRVRESFHGQIILRHTLGLIQVKQVRIPLFSTSPLFSQSDVCLEKVSLALTKMQACFL